MEGFLFKYDFVVVILFTLLYRLLIAKKAKQKAEYVTFFLVFLSTYLFCFFVINKIVTNTEVYRFIFWILLFPLLYFIHNVFRFKYPHKQKPFLDVLFYVLMFVGGLMTCMFYFAQSDM